MHQSVLVDDMDGVVIFGVDDVAVDQDKPGPLKGDGEGGPPFGVPMVKGEDDAAAILLQHPLAFRKNLAQHRCVLPVAICQRVHRRFILVVIPDGLVGEQLPQPDPEEGRQVAVLHTVKIRRIGDDEINTFIGQGQVGGTALAQEKAMVALL